MQFSGRKTWISLALVLAAAVSGCSMTSTSRAPVEDRSGGSAPRVGAVDPSTLPGAENAGKPGFYTVRPGDTIMKIATEVNQPWREIGRWNGLENPNLIEVGQVLRVVPPTGTAVATAPAADTRSSASSSASPSATPAKPPDWSLSRPWTHPGLIDRAPCGCWKLRPLVNLWCSVWCWRRWLVSRSCLPQFPR